jgi:aminoglycoside 6'-N-acetyltransferase
VTLRPIVAADLDVFAHEFGTEAGTGPHQWFGFTPVVALRRRFAENGLLTPDGGVLAVAEAGQTAGKVEWFSASWGRVATSRCWSIAIAIRPSFRGRGIGTDAQRLLAEYLFLHTRVQRIQAFTDVENHAERRALEKAGFRLEGVLRSAQWRGGAWHDQALYSTLRA